MDKHYNDYVQIGLNIMRYRKEAGYTQLQLAEMTGYSHQHIQRVETASSKSNGLACCWMFLKLSMFPSSAF